MGGSAHGKGGITMRLRTRLIGIVLFTMALVVLSLPTAGQVLGPCGTTGEDQPPPAATSGSTDGTPVVDRIPLPGQRATNFELQAVVEDEIKMVKLSDYNDKWRILCFYPADFTFV
jgi:peroxiredoxin (alkyl hydroperoxide reductase subunit C)